MAIIILAFILAFIPVFALTGQEGKLFHPLAFTKTFAMVGATILSVTLVPVLSTLLIGGRVRGEESNPLMRPLVWLYRPVLAWALRHRITTIGVAVMVVAGAVALVPRMGKEFMPPLNEGDLMFMPVTDPAISLPQALEITRKQDAAIQALPEVASVVAKISRADTSTEVNRLDASQKLLAGRVEAIAPQLQALAGIEPDMPLVLRGELVPPPLAIDRALAVRDALARRGDLDAARSDAAMAAAQIAKEQAEGRWDASINVGYERQDFGFGLNGLTSSGATRPIQDVFHYFGGGVTITVPVRNQNQGNVAAARATARAADRRVEAAELAVRQEVRSALAQYEAAQRALTLYERGVRDTARQNLDIVRQTYQLGRASLLDVIAEQRRYIDVEMGYTESLKHVYDAAVDVQRAIGTEDPD